MEYIVRLIARYRDTINPVADILHHLLPMDMAEEYITLPPTTLLGILTQKTANLTNPIWRTWYSTFGQLMMERIGVIPPPITIPDNIHHMTCPSPSILPVMIALLIRRYKPQSVILVAKTNLITTTFLGSLDKFYYPVKQVCTNYPCILQLRQWEPNLNPDLCITTEEDPHIPASIRIIPTSPNKITLSTLQESGYFGTIIPILYKTNNPITAIMYLLEFHRFRKIAIYVSRKDHAKQLSLNLLNRYPTMLSAIYNLPTKELAIEYNTATCAIAIICRKMIPIQAEAIVIMDNRNIRTIPLPRCLKCILSTNESFIDYWKEEGLTCKGDIYDGPNYLL